MANPTHKCEWKIRRLKRLFEETDLPDSEIALECGYASADVVKVLRHRHGLKQKKPPKSLFRDWSRS